MGQSVAHCDKAKDHSYPTPRTMAPATIKESRNQATENDFTQLRFSGHERRLLRGGLGVSGM